MNIVIVGATGLVGRTMIRVLEERDTAVTSLTLLASGRSAGVIIPFRGTDLVVQELQPDSFKGMDVALLARVDC